MGEAKRRAERRREARERGEQFEAVPYDPKTVEATRVSLLVPKQIMTQLRARHNFVKEQCPSFTSFMGLLISEGIEAFDQDIAAFRAHAEGKSKPVAGTVQQDDRMVIPAGEVDPNAVKTLAKIHDYGIQRGRVVPRPVQGGRV